MNGSIWGPVFGRSLFDIRENDRLVPGCPLAIEFDWILASQSSPVSLK
jgi:hypothetical protein